MSEPQIPDLVEELRWRGMLHQCTDEQGLQEHLSDAANTPRRIYAGLDPTADSLTIGNLVTIMALAHAKRAGHEAVVVMGGGTGLIGDPSGKSAERTLMTREIVLSNVESQRPIYESVLGPIDGPPHRLVNNLDWLGEISYIDALRDIGKHFSVNMMMQKESVKERLHNREQGISYTEFSYMILQAYDFLHLFQNEGVTVQFGGSDQFGNIVAGTDLIRRTLAEDNFRTVRQPGLQDEWLPYVEEIEKHSNKIVRDEFQSFASILRQAKEGGVDSLDLSELLSTLRHALEKAGDGTLLPRFGEFEQSLHGAVEGALRTGDNTRTFGLTWPLITKSDGGKFGKTETGAVWLTADRTSPYAYYQFWLNATDADAVNWLKVFTFLSELEIAEITNAHAADPGRRLAQTRLAQEATTILHGAAAMQQAEAAGRALFSGDISSLDESTLTEVFANVPTSEHDRATLADGVDPLELLVETGLAKSKREGREFLAAGSVSVNGEKIGPDTTLGTAHLLHGNHIALRRGKKAWHLTRWN